MLIDNIVVNKIWGKSQVATLSERRDYFSEILFNLLNPPSNPDAHGEKARTIIMNNIKRTSATIKVITE